MGNLIINKVAWVIKLSLQLWEIMGENSLCDLNCHVVDPEFKKSHFADNVLERSSEN